MKKSIFVYFISLFINSNITLIKSYYVSKLNIFIINSQKLVKEKILISVYFREAYNLLEVTASIFSCVYNFKIINASRHGNKHWY